VLALLLADSALPLDEATKYVAGAYIVFVVLLVAYVAIMASKLARIEKELRDVAEYAESAKGSPRMPGREAEDMPVDSSTLPAADSGRSLIPSEADAGPAAPTQSTSGGGGV
jgi:hypothetical protein